MANTEYYAGVKWKELIPIVITVFSMSVAISMGALYLHGQAPHKDALSRNEFKTFTNNVDIKFQRILTKLDKIEERELNGKR